MGNKNYEKGRRFEYERAKHYREVRKCEVMRTAGSHGAFDLIVVTPRGQVEFIQCKVVADNATAERLIEAFKANPPFGHKYHADYHQVLEVKVLNKGIRDTIV